jgi:hypothetical protein
MRLQGARRLFGSSSEEFTVLPAGEAAQQAVDPYSKAKIGPVSDSHDLQKVPADRKSLQHCPSLHTCESKRHSGDFRRKDCQPAEGERDPALQSLVPHRNIGKEDGPEPAKRYLCIGGGVLTHAWRASRE